MSVRRRMRQQIAQGAMIHMGWGWWLLLLANLSVNGIIAMSRIRELSQQLQAEANAWDVYSLLLTDGFFVLLPFGLVFAFLVGSLSVSVVRPWTMLRVGSRLEWWQGQVWLTLLCAVVYTLVFMGGIALLVTPVFPWSAEWSAMARQNAQVNPFSVISSDWMQAFPPAALTGVGLFLLIMGAWGMGLLAQMIVLMTQRPLFGFTVVFVVTAAAIASNNLVMPMHVQYMLPHIHWIFSSRPDPSLLWQSLVYWGVWIIGLSLLGAWFSRRIEIYRQ